MDISIIGTIGDTPIDLSFSFGTPTQRIEGQRTEFTYNVDWRRDRGSGPLRHEGVLALSRALDRAELRAQLRFVREGTVVSDRRLGDGSIVHDPETGTDFTLHAA